MAHKKHSSKVLLLTTGLDFVSSAAAALANKPSPRDVRYAILHLCAGVELILKERLQREHWSLTSDDLRSARRLAYETGDFKSVTFVEAIIRLRHIVGINITDREQATLEHLRKKRNQLEHFGMADAPEALISVAAEALTFLTEFIAAEFPERELSKEDRHFLNQIRTSLKGFELFVQKRWKMVGQKLADVHHTVVRCSTCAQVAAVVGHGTKCLFCGFVQRAEDAALDHILATLMDDSNVEKFESDFPLKKCASCQLNSIVDCAVDTSRQYRYLCFGCDQRWPDGALTKCLLCDGLFVKPPLQKHDICELCQSQD